MEGKDDCYDNPKLDESYDHNVHGCSFPVSKDDVDEV